MRYDWRDTSLVTVHNFSSAKQKVKMKVGSPRDQLLVEVFDGHHSKALNDGKHHVEMDGTPGGGFASAARTTSWIDATWTSRIRCGSSEFTRVGLNSMKLPAVSSQLSVSARDATLAISHQPQPASSVRILLHWLQDRARKRGFDHGLRFSATYARITASR